MAEAGDLRKVVFGKTAKASFNSAWTQGFFAASTQGLSYGLVQTAGGPCGLLATVQAFLLRHLIFVDSSLAASRPPAQCSPQAFEDALFNGLADIIWQAGGGQRASVAVFLGMRCLSAGEQEELRQAQCRPDDFTELLSVFPCTSREQVLSALWRHACEFTRPGGRGVAMVLYSAVLSRGVLNVVKDMGSGEENEAAGGVGQLMGAHYYCSQEMVNLLLIGRAVGNVFDGDKDLDGLLLQGIPSQGEVGLLTLFEHYGSMQVGERLKRPRTAIWVVCSESHFSVLFSVQPLTQAEDASPSSSSSSSHDLYYYDGLSKQDGPIRLTVTWRAGAEKQGVQDFNTDMTPPLEHCIRTRWPAASVDWNGSDVIL